MTGDELRAIVNTAERKLMHDIFTEDQMRELAAALDDRDRLDELLKDGIEIGYDHAEQTTIFAYDRAAIDAERSAK